MNPCVCGHSREEHGNDPMYPGSDGCSECSCIAYEEDHNPSWETPATWNTQEAE